MLSVKWVCVLIAPSLRSSASVEVVIEADPKDEAFELDASRATALLTKPVNWPRPGRSMRHEYRDGHSSQHAAGDTAKYELAQTRVAVAAHHDEIDAFISRM